MQARSIALIRVVSSHEDSVHLCAVCCCSRDAATIIYRATDRIVASWLVSRGFSARVSIRGGLEKRRGKTDGAPRERMREKEEGWVFPLPRLFDPGARFGHRFFLRDSPFGRRPLRFVPSDRSLSEGI